MANTSTVLLVGNQPIARDTLAGVISRDAGLIVCEEASGVAGALGALERAAPDLVVVDFPAEALDGLALVEALHALRPRTGVLVVVAHDDLPLAERVLRAGARGLLTWAEVRELAPTALQGLLRGELYVGQKLSSDLVKRLLKAHHVGQRRRSYGDLRGDRSDPARS
jgi:DNA-binding NarL/FixJ family response regulator